MSEDSKIREAIEAVVTDILGAHVRALHDDIVVRVMEKVRPLLRSGEQASRSLRSAIEGIETGVQQTEILAALLDNSSLFARRTALFVLRGTSIFGWQSRGFEDPDAVKMLTIDSTTGLAGTAVQQRHTAIGPASNFDRRMSPGLGVPRDAECVVVPLVMRDRVAAVLYADGCRGNAGSGPDIPAIEILVRTAGLWIELQALRRGPGSPAAQVKPAHTANAESGGDAVAPPRAVQAGTEAHNTDTGQPVAIQRGAANERYSGEYGTNRMDSSVAKGNAEAMPGAGPDALEHDDELHRKARRFAKLLVDEIVLYNKAKVAEGRSRRDLYDRLKDDIEKSRTSYDKRYGETAVASHDYFTQALISGLADQNPELLGPNFLHRAPGSV